MPHHWDPRREIRELKARVEQAFRQAQHQERVCRPGAQIAPPTDYAVGAEGFSISLDLPGVRREDLDIQVERGALLISGTKPPAEQPEGAAVLRRERTYGAFRRAVPLPDEADVANVTATLKHGELRVTVGRQAEAGPRRVEISEE